MIINCTAQPILILNPSCCTFNPKTKGYTLNKELDVRIEFLTSGICPRCKTEEENLGTLDGVPLIRIRFGEIEGLPDRKEHTYFIVPAIVANAGKEIGRTDLLVPSRVVRDNEGKVVGCLALAKV